ncbi:hypothetical protein [Sphingomonas oryzagri]
MIELDLAALNGRFFDTFDPDSNQIIVDNQPAEDLDETQISLHWTIEPGSCEIVQIGTAPVYEQLGVATLQIVIPTGQGTKPGYAIREQFMDAFRAFKSDDKKLRVYGTSQTQENRDIGLQLNARIKWESYRTP